MPTQDSTTATGLGPWLRRPPIADPVDRRNAPMFQVVLVLLCTLPPLLWTYRIFGTGIPWRPGETPSLLASLTISLMAFFSLVLLRRGRFQWAIRQMLIVVAAMLLLTYATAGLSAQVYEQPLQVMWLFVAGIMVGRRALWLMYAVLVAALFAGAVAEARMAGDAAASLLGDATIRSAMFLLIAVVVDRSTAAMRGSLEASMERGRELAASNALLEEEILARERTQEQLLHAKKVEVIGHMASGVAHDFNHFLALILGYVERSRMAADAEELRESVSGIEAAARRASDLTHRLLDFSRHDATRPTLFDAREALKELSPLLHQTLGPRIRLHLQLPASPCHVRFDRAQFGLMVLNLAANSAQAIAGEGRFEVAIRPHEDGSAIDLVASDNGQGIPPEVAQRVFEPFFTTKPAGQGTGLGLSIVANMLAAFDGRVDLQSTPGTGTRIRITLPLAALATMEGVAEPGPG